jgi:hypothetical protein
VQSIDPDLAAAAAKRVASGDLAGVIGSVPEQICLVDRDFLPNQE